MSGFDPATFAMTFWRNGPSELEIELWDEDAGAPIDLTGQRLWMQWREYEGAGTAHLDVSTDDLTGDRIEVRDAAGGIFAIVLTEATKDALPWPLTGPDAKPTRFAYDLRLGPAGDEPTIMGGKVYLMTGTTRDDA